MSAVSLYRCSLSNLSRVTCDSIQPLREIERSLQSIRGQALLCELSKQRKCGLQTTLATMLAALTMG